MLLCRCRLFRGVPPSTVGAVVDIIGNPSGVMNLSHDWYGEEGRRSEVRSVYCATGWSKLAEVEVSIYKG